jgi:hypothetical protein
VVVGFGYAQPTTDYAQPAIDYAQLAVGCAQLAIGCAQLAVGYALSTVGCAILTICERLFIPDDYKCALRISLTAWSTALAVNAIYKMEGLWLPVLVMQAPSVTKTFLQL